ARVARGVAEKHARVRRRRHPPGQHGAVVDRGRRGMRHWRQCVQAGCRFCTRARGRRRVWERVSCADAMTTPQARENHASARFDIVALGEAMIEFNEVRAGDSRTWLQGFGGDTSNMAVAAARLGARCAYVTRVGDDDFGRRLFALWNGEGVSTEGVAVDEDAPTGVYFVSHGPEGHAFSYLRSGSAASRMTPALLPFAVLHATRVLHLSAISQAISTSACDACFAAVAAAHAGGAHVCYDTNLRLKLWPLARARAIVFETLRTADWALPGLDDATLLFGHDDPSRIIDACHALGSAI